MELLAFSILIATPYIDDNVREAVFAMGRATLKRLTEYMHKWQDV